MRLRPTPPAVPPELLARFGDPEHVFGPNVRFRVIAAVCGGVFVVMGVIFLLLAWAWLLPGGERRALLATVALRTV